MATIAFTGTTLKVGVSSKATWTPMATGDNGEAVKNSEYADRSVHVSGTFGGATCTIQGSNDGGATWVTLTDTAGAALTFTSAGLRQILQVSQHIRPVVTGGVGVAITVDLVMVGK